MYSVMNGSKYDGPGGVVGLPQRKRWKIEPRYQIVLACFFATLTAYVERVGFSISFTEIAKQASLDESVKGTVLSAFYWGYAVSQASSRGQLSHSRACKPLASAVMWGTLPRCGRGARKHSSWAGAHAGLT